MTLRDGTQHVTESRPDTASPAGYCEFEDIAGNKVRVRAADVATIQEED